MSDDWVVELDLDDTDALDESIADLFESSEFRCPHLYDVVAAVMGEDGELLGVVVTPQFGDEITIVVREEDQRQGIGTAMLVALEEGGGAYYAVAGSEGGVALLYALATALGRLPENIEWAGYEQSEGSWL